jgi:hypothetical protein
MKNVKNVALFLSAILLTALLVLSACNLQSTQGGEETTTPFLTLQVQEAVEYRSGPGEAYDVVGTLDPGQEVEAVGRSQDGAYWIIRDPDNSATLYWLLDGIYLTVISTPLDLPIATPPPTPTLVGGPMPDTGCPSPVPSGPTPVSCSSPVPDTGGCPSPVPSGPTPVSCSSPVPDTSSGCPSPVPSGPTPVSCSSPVPDTGSGCPSPVPYGPTPVSCSAPYVPPGSGCPSPIPSGPTPVDCSSPFVPPVSGCPSPIPSGPTPVSCKP